MKWNEQSTELTMEVGGGGWWRRIEGNVGPWRGDSSRVPQFWHQYILVPLVHKTLANMLQPPIRQSSLYKVETTNFWNAFQCKILMSKLRNSRQQQPATLKWAPVRQMNIASQGLNIVLDYSYTGAWLYGNCFEAPINKIYRYIEQLKCDPVLWQKLKSDKVMNL